MCYVVHKKYLMFLRNKGGVCKGTLTPFFAVAASLSRHISPYRSCVRLSDISPRLGSSRWKTHYLGSLIGSWFGVQLCALQNRASLPGSLCSMSTCCSGRQGTCFRSSVAGSCQHSPFPPLPHGFLQHGLPMVSKRKDTRLHLLAETLLSPKHAKKGSRCPTCLLGFSLAGACRLRPSAMPLPSE